MPADTSADWPTLWAMDQTAPATQGAGAGWTAPALKGHERPRAGRPLRRRRAFAVHGDVDEPSRPSRAPDEELP